MNCHCCDTTIRVGELLEAPQLVSGSRGLPEIVPAEVAAVLWRVNHREEAAWIAGRMQGQDAVASAFAPVKHIQPAAPKADQLIIERGNGRMIGLTTVFERRGRKHFPPLRSPGFVSNVSLSSERVSHERTLSTWRRAR